MIKRRAGLFLMIFFLAVFLIAGACAEEIDIDYPNEVNLNQEFEVHLQLINFSEGIYDVKIDILSEGIRIAEILNNDEWKSTYYYINEGITSSEEKDFSLKITKEFENALIEIKIRDSEDKVKTFTGYEIESSSEPSSPEDNEESSSNETVENEEEKDEENESAIEEEISNFEEKRGTEIEEEIIKPIILNSGNENSKSIKSSENKEILKRNLAIGGIITFCLAFGAVFLIKSRKGKNEFR